MNNENKIEIPRKVEYVIFECDGGGGNKCYKASYKFYVRLFQCRRQNFISGGAELWLARKF